MFDPKNPYNQLPTLPGDFEYDKKELLKLAIRATEEISKLNGLIYLIPNRDILISPLLIKESVESSAIENINTTTLKVLQSNALPRLSLKGAEKEVLHYHQAVLAGFEKLKQDGGIGYNFLLNIQSLIEPNKPGVRKIPGTVIANGNGEVLYTPPAGEGIIISLLSNLEKFINAMDDDISPLIKMPIIHYQFESIHPFYDGNGRTGRILNVLYLVLTKKLDFPILFLSEYINKTKSEYYSLLSETTRTGDYTRFTIYLLQGVISQAQNTSEKVMKIRDLMEYIQDQLSGLSMDSHKITKILFSNPFLTVSEFTKHMGLTRQTVSRYIKTLEDNNIISVLKIGKNKLLYIPLFVKLLT